MRHEAIQQGHDADSRDVAAVWPSTTQLEPHPHSELEPPRAADD
jgi:hypothetical protein